MSEFSKCWWKDEVTSMESCYKLFTWINHTLLMLLLQIFWKVNQISDFFIEKSAEEAKPSITLIQNSPLTKESKLRRHIRSMSDVQSSTPYQRLPYRSRKGSNYSLTYDSDTRARRLRLFIRREMEAVESSDSSDYPSPIKPKAIEQNILKHTDSMRLK